MITTTELFPNDAHILKVLEKNKKNFEKLFHQYFKSGQDAGQLTSGRDLKALAAMLFVLYNGIRVVAKIRSNK